MTTTTQESGPETEAEEPAGEPEEMSEYQLLYAEHSKQLHALFDEWQQMVLRNEYTRVTPIYDANRVWVGDKLQYRDDWLRELLEAKELEYGGASPQHYGGSPVKFSENEIRHFEKLIKEGNRGRFTQFVRQGISSA